MNLGAVTMLSDPNRAEWTRKEEATRYNTDKGISEERRRLRG
jgi:hypothetical protein